MQIQDNTSTVQDEVKNQEEVQEKKRELRSSSKNQQNEDNEDDERMPQFKSMSTKERIREALNDLFKQAIVGRSWKNKESEVVSLCKMDVIGFAEAIKSIMIKIMLIPSQKHKSADELILIFLKIYEVLNKHFTGDKLKDLYQSHIEVPFLLT